GNGGGKGYRHETRAGVEQHGAGQAGDGRGQKKVDLVPPSASKARLARVQPAIHKLKPYLADISSEHGDKRRDPRLLKAKDGMAENVEDGDGNGKAAQPAEAIGWVRNYFHRHRVLLAGEASRMVCRPGVRRSVSR